MSDDRLTEEERDLYAALADALGVELVELPVAEVAKLRADVAAAEGREPRKPLSVVRRIEGSNPSPSAP